MDNLSYLNQISQSTKPVSPSSESQSIGSIFQRKGFKIFLIVTGIIIILCIIFGIVNSLTSRETDFVPRLQTRTANLSKIVKTYTPKVKNSPLRATGSSLSGALENLSTTLGSYSDKKTKPSETVTKEETRTFENMDTALKNAKINGLLDRNYAHQLAYGVSSVVSLANEIASTTDNTSLKIAIMSSTESLNTLLSSLENYSDIAD